LDDRKHSKTPAQMIRCLTWGAVIGCAVGIIIFFFKLCAHYLEEVSHHIYVVTSQRPAVAVLVFAGLILMASAMYLLHRIAPEVRGGGIPRATGIMRGNLNCNRVRTLFGTIIGSFISFFAGLPLGSEGPGVLIGTSLGAMLAPTGKKSGWSRYSPTAGAGAGFAVATGAPITSILFILEEVHRHMTVPLVLITSAASLVASFVNVALCGAFGMSPVLFGEVSIGELSLSHAPYILLLGVIVAVCVWVFDVCIVSLKHLTDKMGKRLPDIVKLLFVFMSVGIMGLVNPSALYGGHGLILGIINVRMVPILLVILFTWRFFMTIFTSNSKATGGAFVPTLCIGALIGALSFEVLSLIGMPAELSSTVILISMCAFLGGTMRAPLTATFFFVEATAPSGNMLYAALAVFVVHFITMSLGRHSFNDVMLEEMVEAQNGKDEIT